MKLRCGKIATNGLDGLYVTLGVLVYATSGLHEGATGLPIGPRAPDADSGVSIDRHVYGYGELAHHGDVDGTSKYSHLGKNPTPAIVDGPLFVETKTNLDSGVLPKPGDPSITGKRRLVEDKTSTHRFNFHHGSDRLQRGPHSMGSKAKSLIAADKSRSALQEETDQDVANEKR